MFYFKGQKKEIRRPIMQVFRTLSPEAIYNDNFMVVTAQTQPNRVSLIRLHANVKVQIPKHFTHIHKQWSDNGLECLSMTYSLLETKKVLSTQVRVIGDLVYEFVEIEISTLKQFSSKSEYVTYRSISDDAKIKDLKTIEEHVITQILDRKFIPYTNKINQNTLSDSVFPFVEFLISESGVHKVRQVS